ncbi:hypothetical protein [Gellertiella hungarica]|uniref:Uncharacterized protein n=1 Tax=Gellertiella hungarica TaxID=1572859 RepID=A0A7W6NNG0_9HYPH|nr:hypothetical protein [Gellertiella hungarica]MBB4067420.1 hypothetical protein [Gellertiella hungarica]
MFALTPYPARHMVHTRAGSEWHPCRVIGIDVSGDEPHYVVEVRADDGSFYLEKAGMIRKDPPRA